MALSQTPEVGDKLRYWISPDEYEVTHIDDSGTVTAKTKDGTSFNITEDDFELFDLVSKGADNMTEYTAENRVAKKGERIVIVEPNVHDSEDYERGDVFRVDKVDSAGVTTTSGNIVYHEEYEVLPAAVADLRSDAKHRKATSDFIKMTAEVFAKDMPVQSAVDNVEKPAHYTQGKFETIDIIAQIVSGYSDPFVGHCVGTAVKYVSRAPYKHDTPLEDMRKAKRYIEFAIERLEGER